MLFPRVWDASNDQGHADFYRDWLGLAEGEKPNMADNVSFFMGYQMNWMYWRYFMWNFAGKQNDVQGFTPGNVRDGNWISGVSFIDNWRLGNQDAMPEALKNNKANNKLYFLPLILGVMGLIYQYFANRRDFIVVGLLFFFTGIAIVLYLNQAGNQPRERDYAYVGSFYAFAIWIGLGVLQVREWLMKKSGERIANMSAALVCLLAVPVLMGFQEWDDHDRSKKVLARDLAKNYLESCPPNAILFTYGDNDTYPLWYAQEVEGIRPDIRVINNSLLGEQRRSDPATAICMIFYDTPSIACAVATARTERYGSMRPNSSSNSLPCITINAPSRDAISSSLATVSSQKSCSSAADNTRQFPVKRSRKVTSASREICGQTKCLSQAQYI